MKRAKKLEVLIEFILFGIIIGVIEDIIAVKLATGQSITWKTIIIIILVTIPFVIIGEIIVDNIDFTEKISRLLKRKSK